MIHGIPIWFLILGLFLPRLTLLVAYLSHHIPVNDVPMWGGVLLGLIMPRVLIMIYIYEHMGWSVWILFYAIATLGTLLAGNSARKRN